MRVSFDQAEKLSDILSWSEDGLDVVIKNPVSLEKNILSLLFNHAKVNSFLRQVNEFFRFNKFTG